MDVFHPEINISLKILVNTRGTYITALLLGFQKTGFVPFRLQ